MGYPAPAPGGAALNRPEIAIQWGEMGRSFHLRLPRHLTHVALVVFLIGTGVFAVLVWQLLSAARIYPELLLQARRSAVLHRDLQEMASRRTQIAFDVAESDRVAKRLLARYGLVESPRRQVDLPQGGRLLELLFPENSQEARLASDAWVLGERAERRSMEMRAAGRIARDRVLAWERTPSIAPAWGDFSSGFGWRFHPVLGRTAFHDGQDISNRIGVPVVASATGRVETAEYNSSYGNYVVINHGRGIKTLYAHLSAFRCKVGATVRRGQAIGLMGNTGRSTGPHVHYEVRKGDAPVNPLNWILPVTLVP